MTIEFSTDCRSVINSIRETIGRPVTFYVTTETLCSGCTLDPVSNTSTNSLCPICSGYGYERTISGYTVTAHITWGKSDILNWQSAGQLFDGDCRLQVEYIPETITVLNLNPYVEVDGKKMKILNKIPRGVPTLNRILLGLEESDKTI